MRETIAAWWQDGHAGRFFRRGYWGQLLFEKGQGWLRWGFDNRSQYNYGYEPPEDYVVAPPLRIVWCWLSDPFLVLVYGIWDALQGRIEWREVSFPHETFAIYGTMRDRDRKGDLLSWSWVRQ